MGYAGKVEQQARARELRALGWTLDEIAAELSVATSSVSRWVRGVAYVARPRHRGIGVARPHPHRVRALAEVEAFEARGRARLGTLGEDAFLAAGTALYVGEGAKGPGSVSLANADADVVRFFVTWLRTFFDISEPRLRAVVYLHDDLDLAAATEHWVEVTAIPRSQFTKPYRPVGGSGRKRNRHRFGVCTVRYSSSALHREVMGLCAGLLSSTPAFRGSSAGRATGC